MKSEYIDAGAYAVLLRYMTYENALVLRLCLETGLRVGDAVKVRREDISGRVLTFTAEKTGKTGKKRLSADMARELVRLSGGSGFCFKHRDDPDRHRTRQAVWRGVRNAAQRAGQAAHVSPHSARKTYAVGVFQEQGLEACEKELQHDRVDTTMLYAFSNLAIGKSTDRINDKNLVEIIQTGVLNALRVFFGNGKFTDSGK